MASRTPSPGAFPGDRIAKVMARAGLCSRRDAERLIAEGRVSLNGTVLTSPAVNVGPEDSVLVDGRPLPQAERPRLWRYHKPAGLLVSNRDPRGRPTIFDRLPQELPRVVDPAALVRLKGGITIDGIRFGAIEAALERVQGDNAWLVFGLREGKNREVKKVCEHLGLKVNRLIRISFGPFLLGDLPRGAVEEIQPRVLREQLGGRLPRKG
jgi:23S rRNA pseudouridine2605 synthase